MDILTPKGRETLKQEKNAINLFLETFPDFGFVQTPKDTPACIDGIITKNGVMVSGVEVKCRNMTASELKDKHDNKWLVTADKLDRGAGICKRMGIDYRGFLYLVPDSILIIVPIFSYKNGWVTEPEYEITKTQATVNGGIAERLNAYVDVSKATVVANL